MTDYGKRSKPVPPKALSPDALARWRKRERELLTHESESPGSQEAAPQEGHAAAAASAHPADPAGDHDRHGARHKTLMHGQVVFNDLMSTYDCTIRDLSETGALLRLHAPVEIPKAFMLRFGDGQVRQCKVRRRHALELGVEFVD
ncbi:PilZ domain-containing protein [Dongia sp.]|uniref:PilZ domain-containing protein n=1 Tax=Dongia sp. TaxID=1977262 RepID=UPI0037501634